MASSQNHEPTLYYCVSWIYGKTYNDTFYRDSILTSNAQSDVLRASTLTPPALTSYSPGYHLRGNGGNDILISDPSSTRNPTVYLEGSSDFSTTNAEIDTLTGSTSSKVSDVFMLGTFVEKPSSIENYKYVNYRNCYQGAGYAKIQNFNLGTDSMMLRPDLGYGEVVTGFRMGFMATLESISGVGTSTRDTVIRLARTNDIIGVIQDQSLSLQQLDNAGSLEWVL